MLARPWGAIVFWGAFDEWSLDSQSSSASVVSTTFLRVASSGMFSAPRAGADTPREAAGITTGCVGVPEDWMLRSRVRWASVEPHGTAACDLVSRNPPRNTLIRKNGTRAVAEFGSRAWLGTRRVREVWRGAQSLRRPVGERRRGWWGRGSRVGVAGSPADIALKLSSLVAYPAHRAGRAAHRTTGIPPPLRQCGGRPRPDEGGPGRDDPDGRAGDWRTRVCVGPPLSARAPSTRCDLCQMVGLRILTIDGRMPFHIPILNP